MLILVISNSDKLINMIFQKKYKSFKLFIRIIACFDHYSQSESKTQFLSHVVKNKVWYFDDFRDIFKH